MTLRAALLLLEEGPETAHGFLGVPSLVWQVLNLGLFLFLLWYFLRKPAADFFGSRKAGVAAALAKAQDDRERAEQLAAELKARLLSIETELVNLKEAARRDADAEHAALLVKGQADADQILAKARIELDNRLRTARAELTAFAADLSVDLAREILRNNVTPDDEKRLLKEGVAYLTSTAEGRSGTR